MESLVWSFVEEMPEFQTPGYLERAEYNGIGCNYPYKPQKSCTWKQRHYESKNDGRDAAENQPELTLDFMAKSYGRNYLQDSCCKAPGDNIKEQNNPVIVGVVKVITPITTSRILQEKPVFGNRVNQWRPPLFQFSSFRFHNEPVKKAKSQGIILL